MDHGAVEDLLYPRISWTILSWDLQHLKCTEVSKWVELATDFGSFLTGHDFLKLSWVHPVIIIIILNYITANSLGGFERLEVIIIILFIGLVLLRNAVDRVDVVLDFWCKKSHTVLQLVTRLHFRGLTRMLQDRSCCFVATWAQVDILLRH